MIDHYIIGMHFFQDNKDEAFNEFSKGFEEGDLRCGLMVSQAYYSGYAGFVDINKAIELYQFILPKLFEKAYNKNIDYLRLLGEKCEFGFCDGEVNYNDAIKFYAMATNDSICLYRLSCVYQKISDHENYMKYLELAALKNNVHACFEMGLIYESKGLFEDAFRFFYQSAKGNNKNAFYKVGLCYLNGVGTSKNVKEALRYFHVAWINGDVESCYQIGYIYEMDKTSKINLDHAFSYYSMAASHSHMPSILKAASICEELNDYQRAIEFYFLGSSLLNKYATYKIGTFYEFGMGVKLDLRIASIYYSLVEDYEDAKFRLAEVKKKEL